MLAPETTRSAVEWRQARPEDAAISVSVTRRSADQMPFESEDSQITRYKEESPEQQAQRYLLWRGDVPIGRLRFFSYDDTVELDGLVLLPEAGGSVAGEGVAEALLPAPALQSPPFKFSHSPPYLSSFSKAGF